MRVAAAATLTPDPSTQLRYALVLATPGHAAADPETGASMLRELLAQTEMMTQSEVALATVYLKNADERLLLEPIGNHCRGGSARSRACAWRKL